MTPRTEAQKEASRLNGARSKGPVTPEGKEAVSQNALKHGMRAATVVLKYENVADWEELLQELTSDWKPTGITQSLIVRELADAYWRLTRVKKMQNGWLELEAEGCEEGIRERRPTADDDLFVLTGWDILQTTSNSFDRLVRYEAQLQRLVGSSISRLVSLQAAAARRATAAAKQPQETAAPEQPTATNKPEPLPAPEPPSATNKPEPATVTPAPRPTIDAEISRICAATPPRVAHPVDRKKAA